MGWIFDNRAWVGTFKSSVDMKGIQVCKPTRSQKMHSCIPKIRIPYKRLCGIDREIKGLRIPHIRGPLGGGVPIICFWYIVDL